MEKVGALINRLQQQYSQQSGEASLLNTALLLVAELQPLPATETLAGKVSIIMPYKIFSGVENNNNSVVETDNPVFKMEEIPAVINEPQTQQQPTAELEETEQEPPQIEAVNRLAEERYNEAFEDVPTLSQQQPKVMFELNDTVLPDEPSINDKLKQEVAEAGAKLQGEPIKDLRKAIGINDKYLFIKELFRNDEVAYERSVKTINSFNIFPEAEYWMQRELKLKLGWDDNNPTVKTFSQLVRRRFA